MTRKTLAVLISATAVLSITANIVLAFMWAELDSRTLSDNDIELIRLTAISADQRMKAIESRNHSTAVILRDLLRRQCNPPE